MNDNHNSQLMDVISALLKNFEKVFSERAAMSSLLQQLGVSDIEAKVKQHLSIPEVRAQIDFELAVFRRLTEILPEIVCGDAPIDELLESIKKKTN
jgi:hypothetical protein